jgi:anaerobic magnesium-protoporphyrin IX monomethyl ester cyclase
MDDINKNLSYSSVLDSLHSSRANKVILCAFTLDNLAIRTLTPYLAKTGFDADMVFFNDYNDIQTHLPKLLKSDLVGVSLVTEEIPKAILLANEIKKHRTNGKPVIVFGGVEPNIHAKDSLKHCDYVVRGEGEETLLEICSDLTNIKGMKNVSYMDNGKVVDNPLRELVDDLDKYPYMKHDKWENPEEKERYMIMTSRGCPFVCSFCYNSYRKKEYKGLGTFARYRTVPHFTEELIWAKNTYKNLNLIQIYDDNFLTRTPEDLDHFRREYKKHVNIPFFCLGFPNLVTEEKMEILSDAGLRHFQTGIQSGSNETNKQFLHRNVDNQRVVDVLKVCHKYSIAIYFDLLFNNPYETPKELEETLDFVTSLPKPFHLQGHNLLFYPNTEMTTRALNDGLISEISDNNDTNKLINGNLNSPLAFNNSLTNSFYNTHYSSAPNVKLNHLVTLAQILPSWLIKSLKVIPGDVLFYAKLWFKFKKNRDFREEFFYDLLLKKQFEEKSGHSSEEVEETFKPAKQEKLSNVYTAI